MTTNVEQENYNWKALLLAYLFLLVTFTGFKLLIFPFDTDAPLDIIWFMKNSYWLLIYPLFLSSLFIHNLRKAYLTVGNFNAIPDFEAKLYLHIDTFKMAQVKNTATEWQYLPTVKFRKMFNYWFDTERLTISLSKEMIKITGPVYRISQLDDILKWNKDFKT
jgi:hypothetical protein